MLLRQVVSYELQLVDTQRTAFSTLNGKRFICRVGRKICIIATFTGVLGCMLGLAFSRSAAAYIACRVALAALICGTILGSYFYGKYCYLQFYQEKFADLTKQNFDIEKVVKRYFIKVKVIVVFSIFVVYLSKSQEKSFKPNHKTITSNCAHY